MGSEIDDDDGGEEEDGGGESSSVVSDEFVGSTIAVVVAVSLELSCDGDRSLERLVIDSCRVSSGKGSLRFTTD